MSDEWLVVVKDLYFYIFMVYNEPEMTIGQLEDVIAKELTQFYTRVIGTGPRESKASVNCDVVFIRLKGTVRPDEKLLLTKYPKGIEIVKRIRTCVFESIADELASIVEKHTKSKVTSVHYDSSTRTGERFMIFILDRKLN